MQCNPHLRDAKQERDNDEYWQGEGTYETSERVSNLARVHLNTPLAEDLEWIPSSDRGEIQGRLGEPEAPRERTLGSDDSVDSSGDAHQHECGENRKATPDIELEVADPESQRRSDAEATIPLRPLNRQNRQLIARVLRATHPWWRS